MTPWALFGKRCFDLAAAGAGLVLLSPLLVLLAAVVRLTSGAPVFFSQRRVGRDFREFEVLKFRTMRAAPPGSLITASSDDRITPVGRLLRSYKLDELPQLINVVKGEMSLVGPRPEVSRYVEMFKGDYQELLSVRPGITDLASILFRREEELLASYPDPEAGYVEEVLPQKIAISKVGIRHSSFLFDLSVIIWTLLPSRAPESIDDLNGGQDSPRRILFVETLDKDLLNHRLPLLLESRDRGYETWASAKDTGRGQELADLGIRFRDLDLDTAGMNVVRELRTTIDLARTYRRLKPHLIHAANTKPMLYGSIGAWARPSSTLVRAVTGLGFLGPESLAAASPPVRWATRILLRVAMSRPNSHTIFQNPDDLRYFHDMALVGNRTSVIRGSGVDVTAFTPSDSNDSSIVLFAGRLRKEKGLADFAAAAELVKQSHPDVRLVVVGEVEEGHPSAVAREDLEAWTRAGAVEWWGWRDDMPDVLARAAIIVVPTQTGEGVPKILLEAAAAGRPLVTTDVPGCREVVVDEYNGFLVAPGSPPAIAEAIVKILEDDQLREKFGRASRDRAESEFAVAKVVGETFAIYDRLLE